MFNANNYVLSVVNQGERIKSKGWHKKCTKETLKQHSYWVSDVTQGAELYKDRLKQNLCKT